MSTEQILMLSFDEEGSDEIVQRVLLKIKPLSKYEGRRLPLDAIEKTICAMVRKYSFTPQWISMSYGKSLGTECGYYSCGVKASDTHEWLGTVSGRSLYELMAKLCILMYSKVKANSVPIRTKTDIEVKRAKKLEELDAEAEARESKGIY